MSQKPFKVCYVTDIHGSEICWRKFLNAGTFYQADVVIVGGDITIERVQPLLGLHGHISTKAGERYGLAGRWHSTQGAATKRACCRARSSHSTRKSQDKNYVLVNG
jgi:hypothetical protein